MRLSCDTEVYFYAVWTLWQLLRWLHRRSDEIINLINFIERWSFFILLHFHHIHLWHYRNCYPLPYRINCLSSLFWRIVLKESWCQSCFPTILMEMRNNIFIEVFRDSAWITWWMEGFLLISQNLFFTVDLEFSLDNFSTWFWSLEENLWNINWRCKFKLQAAIIKHDYNWFRMRLCSHEAVPDPDRPTPARDELTVLVC